ncbi:MAG: hemerythrin domain-containing protein, partial [Proteobacteria bacterium]|nr:hemerythrin domain-containing protein [Pseudomonadota bacterium]
MALLKADHRAVEKLFAEFEKADDDRKDEIVEEACQSLILHTILEEEIFYPACREAAAEEDPLDEAQVEHDSAKLLIVALLDSDAGDEYRDAQFKVLSEQIKHHVAEEEKPSAGIFAKAQAAKLDLDELGRRIQARKRQLQGRGDLRPTRPVSFQNLSRGGFAGSGGSGSRGYRSTEGERDMPRHQGQDRDRDDQGRFTSDDDRGGGRYGASSYSSYSRSSNGGDNGGRGHGGWYGDSEGHSQAARSRGESRSYRDDDYDDRDYRGRGRDDDDRGDYRSSSSSRGSSGDQGHGGWYGDSEGHSEASRRGWQNPDHGRSGWYGDSRGHAEASRRGWENSDHGRSGWY